MDDLLAAGKTPFERNRSFEYATPSIPNIYEVTYSSSFGACLRIT